MIRLWQRVQDLVGRLLFCVIVLATMAIDRIIQGGHALVFMTMGSDLDPQPALVHLITILLAGSLSMIALGYRARG
jgi:hypothetical protein